MKSPKHYVQANRMGHELDPDSTHDKVKLEPDSGNYTGD